LIAGHDCGEAVPLGNKDELVQRFVNVLERYVDDVELRRRHSAAAYARAIEHFSWDSKARKIVEVYEWVTGKRSRRPRFGQPIAPLPPASGGASPGAVVNGA
jgi:glycosyltransferase involved in cell wall biosynthesis